MRIAVIGLGISGMVAAWLLSRDHEITAFEANDYIGGHTHTVDVSLNGRSYPIDTGFIVFNEKTYPNFTKLMRILGVKWQPSDMSFSVQCRKTGIVFSPRSLNGLFVQRRNLFRPSFHRMLADAIRFRRASRELLKKGDDALTLSRYLERNGYGRAFREHFIIPMGEAIWSADPFRFREFPARYFVEFFHNHGFLNLRDQPRWLVIKGGSRRYVNHLVRPFRDRIRTGVAVDFIRRHPDRVEVSRAGGTENFDRVVIAAHSDQALALLADPSAEEREILGSIPYQENLAILHTDRSVLPPKKAAWASWNYHIPREPLKRVAMTYHMNMLQGIEAETEFCVTLNLPEAVDPKKVLRQMVYHHPVYCPVSLAARKRYDTINGVNRTFFCGAYWGYGFHEDGVNSALAVCRHFGKTL